MTFFKNKNQITYQVFLLLLLALTWMNLFDNLVYESNASTLRETLASFLSLKAITGILAVVSDSAASMKLLGTGVDIAIGKMFEPFKEFTDKASNIMLFSMLSLTLQKFFLAVMQSIAIKVIITINVVILSINHFTPIISKRVAVLFFKILIIIWFLRFMIPVTEVINHQVTENVMQMQTQATSEKMDKLQTRLESLQAEMIGDSDDSSTRKDKIKRLKDVIDTYQDKLERKVYEKDKVITGSSGESSFFGLGPKKLSVKEEFRIKAINSQIDVLKQNINSAQEEIIILENDDGGLMKEALFKIKSMQESINIEMSIFVDEWINTMMLFLLRTVILPLLLLWGLFKIVDRLFKSGIAERMEGSVINRKPDSKDELNKLEHTQ